ncbi:MULTISPECIES: porin [unclassified Massilia]|uniref:porin n=1 Tax=unclassified Massilia TaxID=2609279 RepID=UPI00177D4CD9|nr:MULTISPECIES: porin [unclassified Massilia]MBD8528464.1 porin [Massilia sp. CFBP 13647]MBD8671913.1 porin [Massilia sp. CFBP 13721]
MKKTLIAAAALALAAGAVHAQTTVTIYGIADAGFLRESGGSAGTVNKIGSGMGSYSRIGFRGSEDLGGGMTAVFTLENGHRLDTGEVDSAGSMFNRQAWVGIKGKAGMVSFGRQYTPWHQALAQVGDPFSTGYAGGSKNVFPDFGANVRTSNTVMYTSPTIKGFTGDVAYAFGEQSGSSVAGRNMGASIGYANGPLNLRLAYNHKNSDVAAAPGVTPSVRGNASNKLLAANYDFKVVKAYLAVSIDKGFNAAPLGNNNNPYGFRRPTASTDGNEVLLGVVAPIGPGNVIATLMRKDDRTSFDQDARSWGIGYLYALSKRSTIYTVYGHTVNKNGAGYTVANNTDAGTGDRAFNLGVRHTF